MTEFATQVEDWARKIPGALLAIRNGAAQDAVEEMQTPARAGGWMRIKTGFLWNSLLASTSMMPSIVPGNRPPDNAADGAYSYDGQQVELVILGADLMEPLFFGYTAEYAGIREYRDGFVRMTAQNWRQHVFNNTRQVKSALGL